MTPAKPPYKTIIFLIVSTLLSWFAFFYTFLFWTMLRKKKFDEYGLSLPVVTKTVIKFSFEIQREWFWIVPGVFSPLMLLSILYALVAPARYRLLKWLWILFLILPPLLMTTAALLALELPMQKLHEGLNK